MECPACGDGQLYLKRTVRMVFWSDDNGILREKRSLSEFDDEFTYCTKCPAIWANVTVTLSSSGEQLSMPDPLDVI